MAALEEEREGEWKKKKEVADLCTSSDGTFNNFDAAMNISGAGFRFSKASADTMASNLYRRGINS